VDKGGNAAAIDSLASIAEGSCKRDQVGVMYGGNPIEQVDERAPITERHESAGQLGCGGIRGHPDPSSQVGA